MHRDVLCAWAVVLGMGLGMCHDQEGSEAT